MSDDADIELGDVAQEEPPAPDYVHRLLDALMRHEPLDFDGADVPQDVKDRLLAFFNDRQAKTFELSIADSDALAALNGRLAASVHAEFGALGAVLGATDDFSWQRTSLGILAKMEVNHVGWFYTLGGRAIMWADARHYPTAPDDAHDWQPMFAFGQ